MKDEENHLSFTKPLFGEGGGYFFTSLILIQDGRF